MKQTLFVSTLIAFATICSCQKQDSAGEAQLAQRKTELDVREEALVQREIAVDEREKAVAEREKAVATGRVVQSQRQAPGAAQAEAERQRRIQQLPPELRALIPDPSRIDAGKAQKNTATQDPAVQAQRRLEAIRKKNAMFGAMASPQAGAPEEETTSPSASPTPQ